MDILTFGLDPLGPGSGDVDPRVFERNLAALEKTNADVAALLRRTPPMPGVEISDAPDGGLTGTSIGSDGVARRLASARRPVVEAERLADSVDVSETGVIAVLGFGLGAHAGAIARRLRKTGVLLIYEPEAGLLRAVLERVDHSGWMSGTNLRVITDAEDGPAVSRGFEGVEGVIGMGCRIVPHPASRSRLGERAERFTRTLSSALRAVRTTLVTTLVQGETTLRNVLMNLDHYARGDGIGDLRGVWSGRPAVVLSAGPSLDAALDALSVPGVRERVGIVAVQTVLRPMLERGIKPHFVVALDHHEISRRFYEGLRPEDVEGVTLVAEPKANPAILDAFPGRVRTPSEELLDLVLGPALASEMGRLEPGATVAHLAYELARHLGCDPVLLMGQDLAFTGGRYYSDGAAIHGVWAGELGPFRTLEQLEWERVARMRAHLRRVPAVGGGDVYTDEQMASYLAQFETLIERDTALGLRVIDATGGGAIKRGAENMDPAGALGTVGMDTLPPLPAAPVASQADQMEGALGRLESVRRDVWRVGEKSRETGELLGAMLDAGGDQGRIGPLIDRVEALRDEVQGLPVAFRLAQFVNQTGALNRMKADRAIDLKGGDDPAQIQRLRIERDRTNVRWLADAAETVGSTIDAALRAHSGRAPKLTREDAPAARRSQGGGSGGGAGRRIGAVVAVDHEVGGLGRERDLRSVRFRGRNPLESVVARLVETVGIDEVVLLSGDPRATRALLGALGDDRRVVCLASDAGEIRARRAGVGAARAWTPDSWRGGPGGLTCWDETMHPGLVTEAMRERRLDAAVIAGDDWALLDPGLARQIIDRHLESPDGMRLVFSQAPAGLCPALIDFKTVESLAGAMGRAGSMASIGALVGYVPSAPQSDPIAKALCVQIAPGVRDAGTRFVPDSTERAAVLERALATLPDDGLDSGAVAGAWNERAVCDERPSELRIELGVGRLVGGVWGRAVRGGGEAPERALMPTDDLFGLIGDAGRRWRGGFGLTFDGAGDPLMRDDLPELVGEGVASGIGPVHVRTDLIAGLGRDPAWLDGLMGSGLGVLSVDLLAATEATYRVMSGREDFAPTLELVSALAERRVMAGGIQTPWVVPRIPRTPETLGDIEAFHDRWTMLLGASVIDPPPARGGGIPVPSWRSESLCSGVLTVRCDGSVVERGVEIARYDPVGGVGALWDAVVRARRAAPLELEPKPGVRSAA